MDKLKTKIFAGIFAVALSLGLALSVSAFIGPSTGQNPGSGGGLFYVDSNRNIGFGTASATPGSTFNTTSTESGPAGFGFVFMVASTTNPGISLKNLTSGNTYVWSSRNFGNLQLYRESGSLPGYVVMDINQYGDVAIGQKATSTGGVARLFVGGTVQATAFVGTLSSNLSASNISSDVFGRLAGNGNFAFPAGVNIGTSTADGAPSLGLYVAGSVGIGTVSPGALLEAKGGPAGILVNKTSYAATPSNLTEVRTYYAYGYATTRAASTKGLYITNFGSGDSPGLQGVDTSNAANDILLQPLGGNVGIATTTPTGKLDVVGSKTYLEVTGTGQLSLLGTDETAGNQTDLTLRIGANNANGAKIIFQKGSTNSGGGATAGVSLGNILFQGGTGSAFATAAGIQAYSNGTFSPTSLPSYLTFSTTPLNSTTLTEAMRINQNGNVGIGTTTPQYQLQVTGAADNNNYIAVGSGLGASTFVSKSSVGTWYIGGGVNGASGFNISNSGTANASNIFVLDTTGNVGIATTTPQYKLSVTGSYYSVEIDKVNSGTAMTIDWSAGNTQHVILTSGPATPVAFTFTNGQAGARYTLILKQDGTGGRTVTWPANVRFGSAGQPTLSTPINTTDYVGFQYNGVDGKFDNIAFNAGF